VSGARLRAIALVVLLTAFTAAGQDFYANRLQRGIAEFQRGQFEAAAQDLRMAAFGLVDSIPDYETAQIYLTLANRKLDRKDDASVAAEKVVHAERIEAVFRTLKIDPQVRADFEAALPKIVSAQALARTPTFAALAGVSPPRAPQPAVTPATQPAERRPSEPNAAERAVAALRAGDGAAARRLAENAIAGDYTNALAHAVLANLGWTASDWNSVAEHYGIVRTRRRLTNEENAAFYVALVRSGRTADAAGVRRVLPPAVLAMPLVSQMSAATTMPPSMAAQASPPPSAPAPQPQPQPRQVSPLVAIAKQKPSDATATRDLAAELVEADRLLREGKIPAARDAYLRLTLQPAVNRELSLEIAKGLNRTSSFRASSSEYRKLYPLKRGEEMHMLYEAENRYELGELIAAKQILAAALPALPKSREADLYREKIERGR